MSAKQSGGFRPQLEALEDRLVMSTVHALHPQTVHVVRNTLPAYIFNPFVGSPAGISVHGLSTAGTSNPPANGFGFFPPGISRANFFPPSIFTVPATSPGTV
jgi:hypothetical protein